jgi:hypothetical protein
MMQNKVKVKTHLFLHNFAYHALIDGWSEERLIRYATRFEVFSQENIKNQLKLIFNPAYSTTVFSYNLGTNLIIKKYGDFLKVKDFQNLLVTAILPSDLV